MNNFRTIFPVQIDSISSSTLKGFMSPVEQANPINSAPYIMSADMLTEIFGTNKNRKDLLWKFNAAIAKIGKEVDIECILIGGSFVNKSNEKPRDIDCVVFYKRKHLTPSAESTEGLLSLQSMLKLDSIDARLIPVDVGPVVLIKLVSYFTMLYLASPEEENFEKQQKRETKATLLIVP